MMQESLGGEASSASAKRALAKVQKLLHVVSTKRNALALRDYREALEVLCIGCLQNYWQVCLCESH